MEARDTLPEPSLGYDQDEFTAPNVTNIGEMYTVNDEPSWLQEASPTDRLRLKYEVRPSACSFHLQ